jgi:3',5'-cyclic AMP phosphodiesterase CpdA
MAGLAFARLTDLHLPTPGSRVYDLHPWARLDAALSDLVAHHGPEGPAPVAFAVVTGDLVDRGSAAAYAALRSVLARLPLPVHLMLGNHDDRAAFRAAFPDRRVDENGFVQFAVVTPIGKLLLLLDTHEPGTVAGRLCARRLDWLALRLAEDDLPVLLLLHHPPARVGLRLDRVGLLDADALWEVLARHRARVRHIFHGHFHLPLAGSWRGIPFSAPRSTAHQFALNFAPGEPTRGTHEAPAYAYVRVTEDDIVLHTHGFLGTGPTFPL